MNVNPVSRCIDELIVAGIAAGGIADNNMAQIGQAGDNRLQRKKVLVIGQ